jgi:hypothetical protein
MPAMVCALGPPIRITPSPILGSRVSDVHENLGVHVYVNDGKNVNGYPVRSVRKTPLFFLQNGVRLFSINHNPPDVSGN